MSHAEWARRAELDLQDIYLWIARRDGRRTTARKIVREIREQCDEYAAAYAQGFVLGTARPDLGELSRVFTYKRWVIVFRPIDNGIEVQRVIDGSRDFSRIFWEQP